MSDLKDFVIENGVLEKYMGNDTDVIIPDSVTEIGPEAFKGNEKLVSIAWPKGLIAIGKRAFEDCLQLASVVIPDGITKIEEGTFAGCKKLTCVTLPDSITEIGKHEFRYLFPGAFEYCTSLVKVNIPDSVKLIGSNTFRFCSSLEFVSIPTGAFIGYDAFVCTGLQTIAYSEGVECAKTTVFSGCDNIQNIIAPTPKAYNALWKLLDRDIKLQILKKAIADNTTDSNIIKKIKDNRAHLLNDAIKSDDVFVATFVINAFGEFPLMELDEFIEIASNAVEVKSVLLEYKSKHYPQKVIEEIKSAHIDKELGLRERTESEWKKIFTFETTEEGLFITNYKDTSLNIIVPSKIGKKTVVGIDDECFSAMKSTSRRNSPQKIEICKKIETISLPESVKYIGWRAFAGCKALKKIIGFSNSVQVVHQAFEGCDSLSNETGFIIFNKEMHQYVGCDERATIPSDVTKISAYAFIGRDTLKEVIIPDGVLKIEHNAFAGCKNLTNIIFPNSATYYDVSGCNKLQNITIPDGVTTIYLANCKNLKKITIPDSVTSIGDYAFSGCEKLQSITFPNNLEHIGCDAFSYCRKLTSITFPDSVVSVGDGAFSNCENLTDIVIPNSVASIGKCAFKGCKNLADKDGFVIVHDVLYDYVGDNEHVVIPDGVIAISKDAFKNHVKITSINIPESVTDMGENAFMYCKNLTSIVIPESITTLEAQTFSNCTMLSSITIPDTVKSIAKYAMSIWDSKNLTIHAPAGSYAEQYAKENNIPFVAE